VLLAVLTHGPGSGLQLVACVALHPGFELDLENPVVRDTGH